MEIIIKLFFMSTTDVFYRIMAKVVMEFDLFVVSGNIMNVCWFCNQISVLLSWRLACPK